eukprot:scaffold424713_cov34-Prasinocladus_malaysianus.AAC.1
MASRLAQMLSKKTNKLICNIVGGRGPGRGIAPFNPRGRGRRAPMGRGPGRGSWSKLDTRTTTGGGRGGHLNFLNVKERHGLDGSASFFPYISHVTSQVVRVVEVPDGVDLDMLKQHFSKFGEVSLRRPLRSLIESGNLITSATPNTYAPVTETEADLPSGARITFENRKQAEAALIGGKKLGDHTMILQWGLPFASMPVPTSPNGAKKPASTAPSTSGATQQPPPAQKPQEGHT